MAASAVKTIGKALDGNAFRGAPDAIKSLKAYKNLDSISMKSFGKTLENLDQIDFRYLIETSKPFAKSVDDIFIDKNLVALLVKNVKGTRQQKALLKLIDEKNLTSYLNNPNAIKSMAGKAEVIATDVVKVVRAELKAANGDIVGAWPKIKKILSNKWTWIGGAVAGAVVIPALVFVFTALDDYLKNNGRTFPIVSIKQKGDTGEDSWTDAISFEQGVVIKYDGDGFEMKPGRKVSVADSNSLPSLDNTYEIETSGPNVVGVTCCKLKEDGGARGYVKYSFSYGDAFTEQWEGHMKGVGSSVGSLAGSTVGSAASGLFEGLFEGGGWIVIVALAIVLLMLIR